MHPLMVLGGVVIGDDRHHALRESYVHCVGQSLYFHNDAHRREDKIAVRGRKDIEADIGQVEQARQHRGRDADGTDLAYKALLQRGCVLEDHTERRFA